MFSSRRLNFVVPGIGTIQGFFASSQASAICAGVAFFRSPTVFNKSTSDWLASSALGVKRGTMLRKSVLSNLASLLMVPVRKPFPNGLKGDEADAQFLQRRQERFFRTPPPQRVLALNRGDWMDGVSAPHGVDAGFRQAPMFDLAFLDQVPDGSGNVFDRDLGVHAMLVVEIDHVGLQSLQR